MHPSNNTKSTLKLTLIYAITALTASLAFYFPLLKNFKHQLLDDFDGRYQMWVHEWGFYSLWGQGRLLDVFHANIFSPDRYTLAWSDNLLVSQLLYPLCRWLFSGQTVPAINLLTLSLHTASFIMIAHVYFILTKRLSWALLGSYIVHYSLVRSAQWGHFQIQYIFFSYLIIAFTWLVFNGSFSKRTRYGLILALASGLSFYGLALSLHMAIPALAMMLLIWLASTRRIDIACILKLKSLRKPLMLSAGLTAFIASPALYAYLKVVAERGKTFDVNDSVASSAHLLSFFDAHFTAFFYATQRVVWASHESRLNFGVVCYALLGLTVLLLGTAVFKPQLRPRQVFKQPILYQWFVLGCGCFLLYGALCFGYAWQHPQEGTPIQFIGYLFYKLIPGFGGIRNPGRFGLMMLFFILPILTYLFTLMDQKLPSYLRKLAFVLVFALFVGDNAFVLPVKPAPILPNKMAYQRFNAMNLPKGVLYEVPILNHGHFSMLVRAIDQMLGSTYHWHRIVNGYTGMDNAVVRRLRHYEGRSDDPHAMAAYFNAIKSSGVDYLILHYNQLSPKHRLLWQTFFDGHSATELGVGSILYQLNNLRPHATQPHQHTL